MEKTPVAGHRMEVSKLKENVKFWKAKYKSLLSVKSSKLKNGAAKKYRAKIKLKQKRCHECHRINLVVNKFRDNNAQLAHSLAEQRFETQEYCKASISCQRELMLLKEEMKELVSKEVSSLLSSVTEPLLASISNSLEIATEQVQHLQMAKMLVSDISKSANTDNSSCEFVTKNRIQNKTPQPENTPGSNRQCRRVLPMVMGHVLQQPRLELPKVDSAALFAAAQENRQAARQAENLDLSVIAEQEDESQGSERMESSNSIETNHCDAALQPRVWLHRTNTIEFMNTMPRTPSPESEDVEECIEESAVFQDNPLEGTSRSYTNDTRENSHVRHIENSSPVKTRKKRSLLAEQNNQRTRSFYVRCPESGDTFSEMNSCEEITSTEDKCDVRDFSSSSLSVSIPHKRTRRRQLQLKSKVRKSQQLNTSERALVQDDKHVLLLDNDSSVSSTENVLITDDNKENCINSTDSTQTGHSDVSLMRNLSEDDCFSDQDVFCDRQKNDTYSNYLGQTCIINETMDMTLSPNDFNINKDDHLNNSLKSVPYVKLQRLTNINDVSDRFECQLDEVAASVERRREKTVYDLSQMEDTILSIAPYASVKPKSATLSTCTDILKQLSPVSVQLHDVMSCNSTTDMKKQTQPEAECLKVSDHEEESSPLPKTNFLSDLNSLKNKTNKQKRKRRTSLNPTIIKEILALSKAKQNIIHNDKLGVNNAELIENSKDFDAMLNGNSIQLAGSKRTRRSTATVISKAVNEDNVEEELTLNKIVTVADVHSSETEPHLSTEQNEVTKLNEKMEEHLVTQQLGVHNLCRQMVGIDAQRTEIEDVIFVNVTEVFSEGERSEQSVDEAGHHGDRTRRAASKVCYKEPSLKRKLRRDDHVASRIQLRTPLRTSNRKGRKLST